MPSLKLLINQLNSIGGVHANKERILKSLDEDFDLAVFPELFYSGYLIRDRVFLHALDQQFVETVRGRLGDRMLIFGSPFHDGSYYNAAVIVTKKGMQVYKKVHLPNFGPFEEGRYFGRGGSPLTVEFNGFKIGVEICYDLFFAASTEKGVDIILNISASPFASRPFFERVFPARAIENQAYLVYVNTAGLQRNQVFWGGSRVIDPDGRVVFQMSYNREATSPFTLDREQIILSRIKRRVLRDAINEFQE